MSLFKNNIEGGYEEVEITPRYQNREICDCIAKFSKVPLEKFITSWKNIYGDDHTFNEEIVTQIWEGIQLPKRSTDGSAGYDFFTPFGFDMHVGDTILIPSGIRCEFDVNYGLFLLPRSGLGTKHRLMIANTVPLIDSDYSFADNTGHIMIKLCYDGIQKYNRLRTDFTNTPAGRSGICLTRDENHVYTTERKPLSFNQNDRILQGVFVRIGFADEEEVTGKRTDGLGSTGN